MTDDRFFFRWGARRPSHGPFGSLDLAVRRLLGAVLTSGAIIFCRHLRAANCLSDAVTYFLGRHHRWNLPTCLGMFWKGMYGASLG